MSEYAFDGPNSAFHTQNIRLEKRRRRRVHVRRKKFPFGLKKKKLKALLRAKK
jgi:hypothetical protein